MIEPLQRVGG